MYLQTMGSEEVLGFAWARGLKFPANFKLPSFPKINPPRFPAPPRFVPPRFSPPRIKAPVIKAPVIKAPSLPKVDFNKIQKELARPSQQLAKTISQGAKSLSKGLESVFSNFSPSAPGEQMQEEEQFYEPEQASFNEEPILTEEPVELTQQESEEMLGALTQGQAGMLNTGFSFASSLIPGAGAFMPMAQNLISQATKKPAKKPNPLQLLQQLQKKPAPRPAPRPIQKAPLLKATQRNVETEKKSDNTLLIIGGVAVVALLMLKKKR